MAPPIPGAYKCCLFFRKKRVFADVLKDLEMEECPGLPRWALNIIINVFLRERQRELLHTHIHTHAHSHTVVGGVKTERGVIRRC